MKKFLALTVFALSPCVAAFPAMSQIVDTSNSYFELGVSRVMLKTYETTSLSGRFGLPLQDGYGIEVEAGYGLSGSKNDINPDYENKVDYYGAVYGTYTQDLSDSFSLTGKLGFGFNKLSTNISSINETISSTDGGVAYGIGARYRLPSMPGHIRADIGQINGATIGTLHYSIGF